MIVFIVALDFGIVVGAEVDNEVVVVFVVVIEEVEVVVVLIVEVVEFTGIVVVFTVVCARNIGTATRINARMNIGIYLFM